MTYIIREKDGEHFVIPSYRDVLHVKNKSEVKRDIHTLSQNYGEYITLQKKSPQQYEVAFSPDAGYLLGESVWHQFKNPPDFIYCEALSDNQALLVIVKAGSVYLDGSFPLEGIPEELVIFLTQENHFDIYTYGDVPIAEEPTEGKFSFEAKAVRSFTVLDKPVFPTLPLLKNYRLQLVDPVLRSYGIGGLPVKQIILGVLALGLLWMAWSYFTAPKEEVVVAPPPVNPYQAYNSMLASPDPYATVSAVLDDVKILLALPAWTVNQVTYAGGTVTASARAAGGKIQTILDYGNQNGITVTLNPNNVTLTMPITLPNRPLPNQIYPIKQVVTTLIDRMTTYINSTTTHIQLGQFANKGSYTDILTTLNFSQISPDMLLLLTSQLHDLPIALQTINLNVTNASGGYSGSMTFDVLGS